MLPISIGARYHAALFVDKGNGVIVYGLEMGTGTEHVVIRRLPPRNFEESEVTHLVPYCAFKILCGSYNQEIHKKGCFGENRHIVITGSDHGKVYVFMVNKTEPMQILDHESEGVMIQSVETTTVSDCHLICSGSSDSPSSICIWEKLVWNARNAPVQQGIRDSLTVLMLFNVIMITLFWSASVWAPTLDVHTALFVADPELLKLKLADMEVDLLEVILNMDEETFRRLFNMPKLTEADLQRSEAEEMDEID
ncbi:hypothetical protein BYT27DRAFT_7254532 [Phlegmacium glaucopus]|nr:hypothetical protein BYT27DRAFT_7254532 [Phlegmacium glaucopus]